MEKDPHQLIEGIMIACHAIRSNNAYLYLRYEYGRSYRVLDKAVKECYAAGLLGKNILGTGFNLDIVLHRGAGAYICGEETGLIESLEGKRAWPRIKPPFPAIEGLFRKPTIVNNVETLCCVTQIMRRGVDWFKSIGVPPEPGNPRDPGSYGPKLYCVSGHVNNPCCVELPLGVTARELIDEHAGGVWKGRKAKAVVPGGISMDSCPLRNWTQSWTSPDLEKLVVLDSGPQPSLWSTIRPTWLMCFTTAAALCLTNPAVSAPPVAKARTG